VRKFRWAIIGLTLAWFIIALTNATNLDREYSGENQFKAGHWTRETRDIVNTFFEPVIVDTYYSDFVFGIENYTNSEESIWKFTTDGVLFFDSDFDHLESAESQDFMLKECADLKNQYYIYPRIQCWIEDYAKWYYETNNIVVQKNETTVKVDPEGMQRNKTVYNVLYSSKFLLQGDAFAASLKYWVN